MRDPINGQKVHVCQVHHPPRSGHYGDTGEWEITGAVADESDAQEWVEENPDHRRYRTVTIGLVSDY